MNKSMNTDASANMPHDCNGRPACWLTWGKTMDNLSAYLVRKFPNTTFRIVSKADGKIEVYVGHTEDDANEASVKMYLSPFVVTRTDVDGRQYECISVWNRRFGAVQELNVY